jgi:predicted metal-dependent peptidase
MSDPTPRKPEKISPEIATKAEKQLGAARAKLLLKNPFFGVLLSMTNFIREDVIPTMATNGINVYYNPKFVTELTDAEIFGVLLHEISHCIYLHCNPKRRLNREQAKWNIATDFAINIEIKDMNYTLPQKLLLDDKYRNHNAEMVYDALPKDADQKYQTLDIHIEPSDGTEDWDDMEDKIISVYEMTKDSYNKKAGNMPGNIKRWIDKMRKSKVKWERIFHRYVGQALAKDDYSYIRPNRRYISQDLYIPDLRNHIVGNIVLAVDTSGSISEKQLEQFYAELVKLSYLIDEITVISCDCQIQEVIKIHKMENFLKKISFAGRGGTSFDPVFDKVTELKLQPEILIYLTDGYGSCGKYGEAGGAPHYPVIWVYTEENSPHANFGSHIHMPDDKEGGGY